MTLRYKKLGLLMVTAALFSPLSAVADETGKTSPATATEFQVTTARNGLIQSGVEAFEKADYEKAVALNKAVIRIRPNRRSLAAAQSNLCASWAMLGDMAQAEAACDAALKIRPDYAPALSNKSLLRTRTAEK